MRASSWNQTSIGLSGAARPAISSRLAKKFFERRNGLAVLGMMARPGRQFTEPKGTQFTAQGLLAERNCKLVEDPLRQIDQSPAHHPVRRWDRPILDNP